MERSHCKIECEQDTLIIKVCYFSLIIKDKLHFSGTGIDITV